MIRDYDGVTKVMTTAQKRKKMIIKFVKENGLPIKNYAKFIDFATIVEHDASEPHQNVIVLLNNDKPVGMYCPKSKTGYAQHGSIQKDAESALATVAIEGMENRPKKDGYLGKQCTIGPGWAES